MPTAMPPQILGLVPVMRATLFCSCIGSLALEVSGSPFPRLGGKAGMGGKHGTVRYLRPSPPLQRLYPTPCGSACPAPAQVALVRADTRMRRAPTGGGGWGGY